MCAHIYGNGWISFFTPPPIPKQHRAFEHKTSVPGLVGRRYLFPHTLNVHLKVTYLPASVITVIAEAFRLFLFSSSLANFVFPVSRLIFFDVQQWNFYFFFFLAFLCTNKTMNCLFVKEIPLRKGTKNNFNANITAGLTRILAPHFNYVITFFCKEEPNYIYARKLFGRNRHFTLDRIRGVLLQMHVELY